MLNSIYFRRFLFCTLHISPSVAKIFLNPLYLFDYSLVWPLFRIKKRVWLFYSDRERPVLLNRCYRHPRGFSSVRHSGGPSLWNSSPVCLSSAAKGGAPIAPACPSPMTSTRRFPSESHSTSRAHGCMATRVTRLLNPNIGSSWTASKLVPTSNHNHARQIDLDQRSNWKITNLWSVSTSVSEPWFTPKDD